MTTTPVRDLESARPVGNPRVARFSWAVWTVLVVLALAAAVVGLAATRLGVGTGSDSAVYVSGAQNLARGDGYVWRLGPERSRPITHYPPLYSLVLALFEVPPLSLLGGALVGARILGIILFSASVLLAGWLLYRSSGNWAAAVLGSLLLLLSADLIAMFGSAMTEGLLLALMLTTVFVGIAYAEHPTWSWLAALAGVASLMSLTKYGGLAMAAAVSLVVLLPSGVPRRVRLAHFGGTIVVFLLSAGLWTWWTAQGGGGLAHRSLAVNPISLDMVKEVVQVLPSWVFPMELVHALTDSLRLRYLLLAVLLLPFFLGVGVYRIYRRQASISLAFRSDLAVPILSLAMGVAYLSFHLLAIAFSYPIPDTNVRTLSPALLAVSMALLWALGLALSVRRVASLVIGGGLLVAAVVFKGPPAWTSVKDLYDNGSGYSSLSWTSNPTIAALLEIPSEKVYTDDEGAVFFLAGRFPFSLPNKWNLATGQQNPGYTSGLLRMREDLQDGAVLVMFSSVQRMPEQPTIDELTNGLVPVFEEDGGGIYAWPK